MPSPEGTPPVFAFAATFSWDKAESILGVGSGVDLSMAMEDMAKFSDKKPIILSGEAVGRSMA